MKDTTYAVMVVIATIVSGHFHPLVSCFMVPSAAKHGTYNNTKIMKTNEVNGVNNPCIAISIPTPSSPTPNSVPKVLTTTSLATTPNNNATDGCHSPNPNGAKIGDIAVPI